eukprot:229477-Chlamydomonas_euryale.AAC.5
MSTSFNAIMITLVSVADTHEMHQYFSLAMRPWGCARAAGGQSGTSANGRLPMMSSIEKECLITHRPFAARHLAIRPFDVVTLLTALSDRHDQPVRCKSSFLGGASSRQRALLANRTTHPAGRRLGPLGAAFQDDSGVDDLFEQLSSAEQAPAPGAQTKFVCHSTVQRLFGGVLSLSVTPANPAPRRGWPLPQTLLQALADLL